MKKLIVAAFAVGFAIAANAASMAWSSDTSGIVLQNGDWADGTVTMYLYEITATDYAKFTGTADAISTAVYNQYGTKSTNSALDDWGVAQVYDSRDFGVGDTAYAAVVFTYTDGDGKEWYKGNIASYEFTAAADALVGALDVNLGGDGIAVGNSGAIAWQSVPEPTSGLLMLVGLAGLALRRRRA